MNIVSHKSNKTVPKILCERYKKHALSFNCFDKKDYRTMKKVIVSQETCHPADTKSYSTGKINSNRIKGTVTPKKTAKSELIFTKNMTSNYLADHCKKCGDTCSNTGRNIKTVTNKSSGKLSGSSQTLPKTGTYKLTSKITIPESGNVKKPIQQYYRNENYYQSSESIHTTENFKKGHLNTILEHSENTSSSNSETIFKIYHDDAPEELGFMDPDNKNNIEELKEFRNNNYFECHSAKSRITSQGSVTSLNNHNCVYRFYLNERLFPVPINADYQENIRCMVCHLPLENNFENSTIDGTVQAKVKLNGKIQDVMVMLPVKKSLIVKERRKALQTKKDFDYVYFGIIKLDLNGDSIFNRNLPSDSLALRYQKGYKELTTQPKYEYDNIEKGDVIIV